MTLDSIELIEKISLLMVLEYLRLSIGWYLIAWLQPWFFQELQPALSLLVQALRWRYQWQLLIAEDLRVSKQTSPLCVWLCGSLLPIKPLYRCPQEFHPPRQHPNFHCSFASWVVGEVLGLLLILMRLCLNLMLCRCCCLVINLKSFLWPLGSIWCLGRLSGSDCSRLFHFHILLRRLPT